MKQIFSLFLFFAPLFGLSQGSLTMVDKPFSINLSKDSGVLNPLERTTSFRSLSKLEQEVAYWLNLVRLNPSKFYSEYIVPFGEQFPEARGPEFNSLGKELRSISSLPPLVVMENLNNVAAAHAKEIVSGKSGFTHAGAGGKSFEQRMKEAGILGCAGENLYEGKDDALVAVILLLIDKDVNGYGHRKVILHPLLNTVGISFLPSKKASFILVQDFSCR